MTNHKTDELVKTLFEMGAHLGHKKARLHPKARVNVYTIINKTSIIDLTKTVEQIDNAKQYIEDCAKKGKTVLVVGTKKTASYFIKEYCSKNAIPFISLKWPPGLLTNFTEIMKNVKKLIELRERVATDDIKTFVKHERTQIKKEIQKLERLYGGIEKMRNRPDFLIIVDLKKEKNVVSEAQDFSIPIVALADTNANPQTAKYAIVANDDDSKVVEFILKDILEVYVKNFTEPKKEA